MGLQLTAYAQAFEKCVVRQWNLSFNCLTSVAAHARLCELKETDPEFWEKLTNHSAENLVPAENKPQPEDIVDPEDVMVDDLDDSDVPIGVIVQELTEKNVCKGFVVADTGVLVANWEAERFDDETRPIVDLDENLGRGKRQRWPNQLYNNSTFWHHDDDLI